MGEPLLCQLVDAVRDVPERKPTDLRLRLTEKLNAFFPQRDCSTKRVLMFTNTFDLEADLVGIGLFQRGIDYLRLNMDDIPTQLRVRYSLQQSSGLKVEFGTPGESCDISTISGAWLRHFDMKERNFNRTKLAHTFSFQQWDDAIKILRNNLQCGWISTPHATERAGDRAEQLAVAKKFGFDIPATLITNDAGAARDFYHDHESDVVLKALHHHDIVIEDKVYSMYTHRLLRQDLSRLDDLVSAPCILQKRIEKKTELRVTVVGRQVFAIEIDSQSTVKGLDDMHRGPVRDLPKRVIKLDTTISERCIKIIDSFGLRYGAIDLVVDKKEHLIFLELNPTGDWYWIEQGTGLAITEAMVDLIEEVTSSSEC